MSQAIPQQHPAVVLRSHYQHLRSLLAIAMVAVVGLSAAVVILATDDGPSTTTTAASSEPQPFIVQQLKGTPFRGGSDESGVAQGISGSFAPSTARPDEAKIAAAVSAREHFLRRTAPEPTRPDESGVAQAISGR